MSPGYRNKTGNCGVISIQTHERNNSIVKKIFFSKELFERTSVTTGKNNATT